MHLTIHLITLQALSRCDRTSHCLAYLVTYLLVPGVSIYIVDYWIIRGKSSCCIACDALGGGKGSQSGWLPRRFEVQFELLETVFFMGVTVSRQTVGSHPGLAVIIQHAEGYIIISSITRQAPRFRQIRYVRIYSRPKNLLSDPYPPLID